MAVLRAVRVLLSMLPTVILPSFGCASNPVHLSSLQYIRWLAILLLALSYASDTVHLQHY